MKTPYDAVIAMREREADEAAKILRQAVAELAAVEDEIEVATTTTGAEAAFEAEDLSVRRDLYLMRMYDKLSWLRADKAEKLRQVEDHREALLQLVAETKALERIAQNFRDAQAIAEARAEQAQVDDRIAYVHNVKAAQLRKGAVA